MPLEYPQKRIYRRDVPSAGSWFIIPLSLMAASPQSAPAFTHAPAWAVRLAFELSGNDQTANSLVSGLTEEQLNWQRVPGSWSIGQCLEHLCITNEAYMPRLSAALQGKADSPVEQIVPGLLGGWFIRSFVEPSPNTKRASAPAKIRPASHVSLSVLHRFLAGNKIVPRTDRWGALQECQPHPLLESAGSRVAFHRGRWTRNHLEPRAPPPVASGTRSRFPELPSPLMVFSTRLGETYCCCFAKPGVS